MKVVIIRYRAGNIFSVISALRRLDIEAVVSDDPDVIHRADRVIFPGVGEAASAMTDLRARGLDQVIPALQQPFLGICLGLQLLCRESEENGTEGLGIFPAKVLRFPPKDKVPHMGWNQVSDRSEPLLDGLPQNSMFYFVHSYYAELCENTTAQCEYILPFSAALRNNNFTAVQFHPEKSGPAGEQLLRNFIHGN